MLAALSIVILPVFAQTLTTESQVWQLTRSKKEVMKIEVMKIQTNPKILVTNASKNGQISNLSSKEQMKASVMKLKLLSKDYTLAFNNSGKCAPCLTFSNLSIKEQMKMKVMGLHTSTINVVGPIEEFDKCSICGIDLAESKLKPYYN